MTLAWITELNMTKWLILLIGGMSLIPDSCTGCTDGTFGDDCASSCDGHHCVGGSSVCSEVDGSCPGDCEQWYTKMTCSQFIRLPKLEFHNNVTVIPENSSTLRVYWQSEDNIAASIAPYIGYIVEYKRDGAQHYSTSPAVPHVDGRYYQSTVISGLQYNTKYTVRIRVYREQGGIRQISDWPTGEVTAMTACTMPDPPFGVTMMSVTSSSVTVQWQFGESGCNRITSVEVLYRRQGGSQWMHHGVANTRTALLIDLEEGSYEVKIIVSNDADLSVETQPTTVNASAFPSTSQKSSMGGGGIGTGVIAGATAAGLLFVVMTILGVVCFIRRQKKSSDDVSQSHVMTDRKRTMASTEKPTVVVMPVPHDDSHAVTLHQHHQVTQSSVTKKLPLPPSLHGTPNTHSPQLLKSHSASEPSSNPNQVHEGIPVGKLEENIHRLGAFVKTVIVKEKDGEKEEIVDGFKQEFDSLHGDDYAASTIGKRPENKDKNRFQNIQPFDKTRVVLDTEDGSGSDYINASYVSSKGNQKNYIASQGPRPNTVNDFWRMIWQQGVNRIVMLTGLVEGGKKKSTSYWSDNIGSAHTKTFGVFSVTTMLAETYADYAYRKLAINHKGERREVHQLHFLSWKDKSCPDEAFPLLAFRERVHGLDAVAKGPLVVHCSAGVGRTGTYIAIDYLIDEAMSTGQVDVFRCVQQLRTQRMNMVQTKHQYRFVYMAVLEATETRSNTVGIPSATFIPDYKTLVEDNAYSNASPLMEQYEVLMKYKRSRSPCHDSATDPVNVSKNRHHDVLPDDEYRPRLYTYHPDGNDYINAVFTDSFKNLKATILTQMPLPSTVSDFWRLVYDECCHTVIMLNHMEPHNTTCADYWPSEEAKSQIYGPMKVELVRITRNKTFITREFLVEKVKSMLGDSPLRMCQFQLLSWPRDHTLPPEMGDLVDLMEAVTRWQQQCHNDKAVIHCMNGADRSGLFAAASYVIDKMKVDQDVNPFLAARYITSRRPEAINSMEQYGFLFEFAKFWIERFGTYANFK